MKEPRIPGAVRALALLLALNTLCYIDRYILAAVEPEIRHAFFAPDDPDAMAKTGALATAFLVSYMILAPLFGWLAMGVMAGTAASPLVTGALAAISLPGAFVFTGALAWAGAALLVFAARELLDRRDSADAPA